MSEPGDQLILEVFRGRDVVTKLDSNDSETVPPIALEEGDRIAFEMSPKAPGREYQIWIGDEVFPPTMIGRRTAEWSDRDYFDSARGPTRLSLMERDADKGEAWRERCAQDFWVTPGKLNDAAFNRMVADLAQLSSGLLFDLLGKSAVRVGPAGIRGARRVVAESAQTELRLIETLWSDFGRALTPLLQQPETGLSRVTTQRACIGIEPLSHGEIARLAAQGVDLRRAETPRPFSANVTVSKLSVNILENRVILAFIKRLISRAGECRERAQQEVDAMLERQRFWRSAGAAVERVDFDRPRRDKLEEAYDAAEVLIERMRRAAQSLSQVGHFTLERGIPETPIFRNVASYHRLWRIMRGYFNGAAITIENGVEERLKQTWRMYEQWTFLQIAAALHQSGLVCENQKDFISALSKHRFTVDLQRGACLRFSAADGVSIRVTYEATIYPKPIAQQANSSVYMGINSTLPWSPDTLIEVFRPSSDGQSALAYAIVVDAKYTRNPTSRLEGCLKYLKIRATKTDEGVVRQIWIAAPTTEGIVPDDPAISWSKIGPTIAVGELVWGVLGLTPSSERLQDDGVDRVAPAAMQFAEGLLAHLNIRASHEILRAA